MSMNKNIAKAALAGLALTLLTPSLRAQTAIRELAAAAGVEAAPMIEHLKASRDIHSTALTLPRGGQDVLNGCSALDAKLIAPMNTRTAALLVQTCLNNRYRADGSYFVEAQVATISVRACPPGPGLQCMAMRDVEGIRIVVTGSIMTGDSVLLDLNATLSQRQNKLLGFDAVVDNHATILN